MAFADAERIDAEVTASGRYDRHPDRDRGPEKNLMTQRLGSMAEAISLYWLSKFDRIHPERQGIYGGSDFTFEWKGVVIHLDIKGINPSASYVAVNKKAHQMKTGWNCRYIFVRPERVDVDNSMATIIPVEWNDVGKWDVVDVGAGAGKERYSIRYNELIKQHHENTL
jgi:hypothetical protein